MGRHVYFRTVSAELKPYPVPQQEAEPHTLSRTRRSVRTRLPARSYGSPGNRERLEACLNARVSGEHLAATLSHQDDGSLRGQFPHQPRG